MINRLSIFLLIIGIVFCGVSPIKASEMENYFASCPNKLWEKNNVKPDGNPIVYKWIFGNSPQNKLYKIEKYKTKGILTALFTTENIEKDIDLESVGSVIHIAVPTPFSRIGILNDDSSEAIENFKKKYIHYVDKTKNNIFIFIEDNNGNFKGHSTKPLIKKLMGNEDSNDVNVFNINPGCAIERQVKDYDIMQTFGHVRDSLDPENKLRCIATIVYTHYGISNPELFYEYDKLARQIPELKDNKFRVGVNYAPLRLLYSPKGGDILDPVPGSTGCELWDKQYVRSKQSCLALASKIKNGNHDYDQSFVENISNDCKKLNIQIK
jgi:hypothetical protein